MPAPLMRVKFTTRAEADFVESYGYGVTQFGAAQADRYAESLLTAAALLAEQPEMARLRTEYTPPVRIHHHRHHYLIYRVEPDHILIIRLLRDDRDLTAHLRGDSAE